MNKSRKKKTLYFLLIGVVVVTLLLLIATWNDGLKWIIDSEKEVPSFRDWLVVILAVLLPILLFILGAFLKRRRKRNVLPQGGIPSDKDGKIKAIGVSNFEEKHIKALLETAEIKPVVNQLEFHPGYTQYENIKYMQENGILVEAWSPLGSGAVLNDEKLKAMAEKYNKNVAQLCVRFALQLGILPLPKSTDIGRMKSNADVFDFEIEENDIKKLLALPLLGFSGFSPEDAPADALAGN